jgi:hypothetical protein
MGPFPDIEGNPEPDFNRLSVGGVKHPAVLKHEAMITDL